MHIVITVISEPGKLFKESRFYNITATLKATKKTLSEFAGTLLRLKSVESFVGVLASEAGGKVSKTTLGGNKIVYTILVTKPTRKTVRHIKFFAKKIETEHFIAPRKEWVSNELYSIFTGSALGCWDAASTAYRRGTVLELTLQAQYMFKKYGRMLTPGNIEQQTWMALFSSRFSDDNLTPEVKQRLCEKINAYNTKRNKRLVTKTDHAKLLSEVIRELKKAKKK